MKHRSTFTAIRQLCALPLGGEALLPTLLHSLHTYIPSYANCFIGAEADGRPRNFYCERPDITAFAQVYLSEFFNTPRDCIGTGPTSLELLRVNRIDHSAAYPRQELERSALFGEVLRPQEFHHWIRLPIRDATTVQGLLILNRGHGEQPFSHQDAENLSRLAPHICHALKRPAFDQDEPFAASGETGMAVFDGAGQVAHLCDQAHRLFWYATHPRLDPALVRRMHEVVVPPQVLKLCDQLYRLYQGAGTQPPIEVSRNAWGQFVFRGYFLSPPGGAAKPMIGVTVEHQVPRRLRRWGQIVRQPLSPKQREVCLLLAEGVSQAEIARRLQVRLSTVVDHVRGIYDRLDLHNRDELLQRLDASDLPPGFAATTPAVGTR